MSTALQESIFDYVDKIDFIPSSKISYADARGPSLTASSSSFSSTAHRSILPQLSPSVCSSINWEKNYTRDAAAESRSRRRSTDATRFDDIEPTDGSVSYLAFVSTDCMRTDIMAKFECSSISLDPTSVTSISSKGSSRSTSAPVQQLPEETTPSLGRQKAEEWNSSLGRRLARVSSVLDPPELIRSLSKRGSVERRGSMKSQKSSKSHKSQSTMSSKSSRSSISTTGSSPKVKDC
ncbi:hypothetical protein BC829DRAFT_389983, partial [Chytridium lagenaria]